MLLVHVLTLLLGQAPILEGASTSSAADLGLPKAVEAPDKASPITKRPTGPVICRWRLLEATETRRPRPHAHERDVRVVSAREWSLVDPATLGFGEGPIGSVRSAWIRNSVGVATGAVVIAQPEEFYGNIRARAVVEGRYLTDSRTEVFAAVEVVRLQTVISSLSASSFGLGHMALGLTRLLSRGQDVGPTYALTGHVTLPTATGLYSLGRPISLNLGVAGSSRELDKAGRFEVHGYGGLRGIAGVGSTASDPRIGALVSFGGSWLPLDFLALVVDLEGAAGLRDVFDHVAAGLAVRARLGSSFDFELQSKVPLLGSERSLVALQLGVTWHL